MAVGTYYLNDPNAPKPNSPTHIGTNVLLEHDGKLLLERRWDCGQWGLIGGRLRNGERYAQGIARELREETGIEAERLVEVGRVRRTHTIFVEFFCETDCGKNSIRLQEGETTAFRWVSREALISMKKSELVTERMQQFIGELQA